MNLDTVAPPVVLRQRDRRKHRLRHLAEGVVFPCAQNLSKMTPASSLARSNCSGSMTADASCLRVSAHRDHSDRSIVITEIGIVTADIGVVITRIGLRDHLTGQASFKGRVAGA
jgi:hypothetical protein